MNGPRRYQNERSGDRETRVPTHARRPQDWASPSTDRAAKRTGFKGSTGCIIVVIIEFALYFSVVFLFAVSTLSVRRFLNTTKYVLVYSTYNRKLYGLLTFGLQTNAENYTGC